MKTVPHFLMTLLLLCSTFLVRAQQNTAPAWSAKFKSAILWQHVHSLGYLLVNTKDALYAYNPEKGQLLWENASLGGIERNELVELKGTELVLITQKKQTSSLAAELLLEVVNGKVLFDSNKEKVGLLSKHVLANSGRLLIMGMRPEQKTASLLMYDMLTGTRLWVNDDLFKLEKEQSKGLLARMQQLAGELNTFQALTSEPYEIDKETIVITHPDYVLKINSTNGNVLWKNPIQHSSKAKVVQSPFQKDIVYIGTEIESQNGSGFTRAANPTGEPMKFYYNLYYAFDLVNGKPKWSAPAKEKDFLNVIIPHKDGLIVCPRSVDKPTLNLINYETGELLWGKKGKGIPAQGTVINYQTVGTDIFLATQYGKEGETNKEEYYLNVLEPSKGQLKFEKSLLLKGKLRYVELIPKGWLYVTTQQINILDIQTGKPLWSSSIEVGQTLSGNSNRKLPTGDNGKGKLFAFTPKEGSVIEIDKTTGLTRPLSDNRLSFEGNEQPKSLEIVKDGIVLSSDQNIVKLGFDGRKIFSNYYPAPRQSALLRALWAAEAMHAAYKGFQAESTASELRTVASSSQDPIAKPLAQSFAQAYSAAGDEAFAYSRQAFDMFKKRFQASQHFTAFMIVMTTTEKKGNQLLQINKQDGSIRSAIDIKNDKNPEYEVDPVAQCLYYQQTPLEIVCYSLK